MYARRGKLYQSQLVIYLTLLLSGCHSSPSQNILGSYFPSWMLCALLGILLTIVIHLLFLKMGIDEVIPAKLLIYIALAITSTFFIWLFWFGN